MPSSIALSIEVRADPAGAFDAFAEELARWAGEQPEEVARLVRWRAG